MHNDISAMALVRVVAEIILDSQDKDNQKEQNTVKSVPRLIIQVNFLLCYLFISLLSRDAPLFQPCLLYSSHPELYIALQKKKKNQKTHQGTLCIHLCTRFSLCLDYNQKH